MSDLEVLGDLLEGFQWCALAIAQSRDSVLQAVIDVILDERALGLAYGFFDSVELLGNVYALSTFFDHGDDAAQVSVRTFEALDDRLVALVGMGMAVFVFAHGLSLGPQ
jgi:hypothetical protein